MGAVFVLLILSVIVASFMFAIGITIEGNIKFYKSNQIKKIFKLAFGLPMSALSSYALFVLVSNGYGILSHDSIWKMFFSS